MQREHNDVFLKKQIQQLAPDRVILGNWRKSFPGVLSFKGNVDEVMSLEDWRHQLRLYGGAPAQTTTPEAHRQALEIAHELSSRAEKSGAAR